MSCLGYFAGASAVHRLDPRVRLVSALTLALGAALGERLASLLWVLALALLLAGVARLPWRPLARRLLRLNGFMLFLWLVLPWSAVAAPVTLLPEWHAASPGVRLAAGITLKGNAIVLLFTALAATVDPSRLGLTLNRLRLPDKLVHLFVLMIRYTDLIHEEYGRLRQALRARAFHARFSLHTLSTFGYLVGMLLVRSMERSERVLAAMKCRGFDGRYHALDGLHWRGADTAFGLLMTLHLSVLIWLEVM